MSQVLTTSCKRIYEIRELKEEKEAPRFLGSLDGGLTISFRSHGCIWGALPCRIKALFNSFWLVLSVGFLWSFLRTYDEKSPSNHRAIAFCYVLPIIKACLGYQRWLYLLELIPITRDALTLDNPTFYFVFCGRSLNFLSGCFTLALEKTSISSISNQIITNFLKPAHMSTILGKVDDTLTQRSRSSIHVPIQ